MKILPFISLSLASTLLAGPSGALAADSLDGAPRYTFSVANEEAIGPFPSWGNVKTKYGAKGDGVTDDTEKLQAALDDMNKRSIENPNQWNLETPNSPAVLYFPPGIYRITKTLILKNQFGANLIGEDPGTTKIVWDGVEGGAMLIADGSFGGKFARLTWDGAKKAGIGVAHWWNRKTPQYGANAEHVDEVFVDMGVGIVAGCCGTSSNNTTHPGEADGVWQRSDYGDMDSEGSIKRTKFINNTVAGVSAENPNSLDWWVMDSEFRDSYRGVTNALGAGNVHVYRNVFVRSTLADINVGSVQWHSMHHNVSIGSRRFLQAEVGGNNGRPLILKNNRIINPTDQYPIFMGNLGPLIMIDNQILSPANANGQVIHQNNNAATSPNVMPGVGLILIGNQFTLDNKPKPPYVSSTNSNFSKPNVLNQLIDYENSVVRRIDISTEVPKLPDTPKKIARAVFEVPVTIDPKTLANVTTSKMIQEVINSALDSTDENPIVHFPRATFTLDATLNIPANRRIQLAGDGIATMLKPGNNFGTKPMLYLAGPSRATVREMRLFSNNFDVNAVVLDKADQPGGRILFDGSTNGPVNLTNLASTKVEFQHTTGMKRLATSAASDVMAVGSGVIGPVTVNANSDVLLLDTWYETGRTNPKEDTLVTGDSGNFTYLGGHVAPPKLDLKGQPAGASMLIKNFAGQFTVMGMSFNLSDPKFGISVIDELPTTRALVMGVSANQDGFYVRNNNAGAGKVGFSMMRSTYNALQADYGNIDLAAVKAGMAQMRRQKWDQEPVTIPEGVTDVLFYRVRTFETQNGYTVTGQ
ncbi:glycosyl hydrolase family 28-related protein [Janthinobacterium sp.]|uniref:glycosyl hydrolase family 28-related protein n=1 Tax=Janthinobacterium sp. TaxID=1871054 RepID=UPI00293D2466|nr:glycosyl hydrolase family 28-related protein [Janthinobacterium sp.]